VIAAARLYELTGDNRYWNIANYFWDEVTSERSYCTGGTSNFELWRAEPGVLSTQLSMDTAEDCCCPLSRIRVAILFCVGRGRTGIVSN
jgi:DUF1680 family protein